MKHIVDHPRSRDTSERLARFAELDRRTGDAPSEEVSALRRQPRQRDAGAKLKRFTGIARGED